ncbi:DUF221 domain protein [Metarhizium acridum CQMa 102]|uniref:DUF221 domain protein n=1 Tax=Metarhizium acridum (strain CQMa 102) TaxID=655827 RepID=E9DXB7_METAQ|nr:DUF221 domain protein [Metarhizium acridum CQMa 102]EFY91675.1 DUF221 domain protein [Metarhizium acridum CQMa 102]
MTLRPTALGALLSRDASDQKDAGQELIDLLKNPFVADKLATTSVYSALATSLGVTAFIAICFSFIRPYHQAIYAPKSKHADEKHAPPPIGKEPWAWITPLLNTKEVTLMNQIGMDATIFLRFIRMCRNMFLILALIGVGILVPVNLTNFKDFSTSSQPDTTEWMLRITPRNVFGTPHWALVVVGYLFNIVVISFLWWNYRKILHLRRMYFESEEYQGSLHARTLMLFDIPRQGCSDEGIARIIDSVVPNSSFARTVVARNVKDLPELIEEHEKTVRKLEKVLAKYLKDPQNLPAARPTCKASKKDRSFDTYPSGQRLDAIDYLTQRIRDLEIEIKEVRVSVDRRSTQPYGFASYSEIAEAHSIAYACRKKKPHGATVRLAPRPTDIIWRNMPLSSATRSRRRWINNLWIAALTILWVAPNAMIAIFLVNLSNLGKVWKGFQRSLEAHYDIWGVVQGIASPALTSLVYLVLPMIFRRLSSKAGDQTKTGRERHVLGKLYAFFVFNNLVVFSFFGVLWSFVAGVIKATEGQGDSKKDAWSAILDGHLAQNIVISFCNNSIFWVTYLLQRQLGAAIDLAQIWPLIVAFFQKKFSSPTPRELIELTAPPPFEYANYYTYFLFYSTVTLCFGTIQPLCLLATAMYFSIDCYLKKYLILYRFVTKTESGGLFWRVVFNRMILGAILANGVVLLTTWARGDGTHMQFYAVCPLPFMMIAFKIYCSKTFDDKMRYYSTRYSAQHPESGMQGDSRNRSDKLASRFGHPALYKPLITPMVHQKAQNLLPSVYRGRLTDGRDNDGGDLATVSGYSDMYALDSMKGGKPGKTANAVPGFEYVSDAQMDFQYYKNRAEFADEHGGGEMYGKGSDIMRMGTPSSLDDVGSIRSVSRPASPMMSGVGGPGQPRRVMTNMSMSDTAYPSYRPSNAAYGPPSDPVSRGGTPLYSHDNGSSSGLVRNAAAMAAPPVFNSREGSMERGRMTPPRVHSPVPQRVGSPQVSRSPAPGPSIGAMGGGPQGYSGLQQLEEADPYADPMQYNYFRGGSGNKPARQPGEGW